VSRVRLQVEGGVASVVGPDGTLVVVEDVGELLCREAREHGVVHVRLSVKTEPLRQIVIPDIVA
jgi:hypothetical protein